MQVAPEVVVASSFLYRSTKWSVLLSRALLRSVGITPPSTQAPLVEQYRLYGPDRATTQVKLHFQMGPVVAGLGLAFSHFEPWQRYRETIEECAELVEKCRHSQLAVTQRTLFWRNVALS